VFVAEFDRKSLIIEDLDMIRNLPGVVDAISTNSFPLRDGGSSRGLQLEPGTGKDAISTAIYYVDEHAINAYGTNLVEGENFSVNQVAWSNIEDHKSPSTGIITQALADNLFPDDSGSVVGKTVYINDNDPLKIIGVIDVLQAAWGGWDKVEHSLLVPTPRDSERTQFVVRTEPGYRDELMPQIEAALAKNKNRIIENVRTMEEVRNRSYLGDSGMVKMLTFIVVLLTGITGFGIVGLASFSVSRRTRQIGVRRALGASRPAILRYFMIENFIISSVGIFVGGIFAVALNIFMVQAFSLTPLAWYVVPIAMIVLWIVGQAAVAGPARRASNISPAIATRSI
jgi:putative ABC transport system permease protein